MPTHDATMAAPPGLQAGEPFSAERIGAPRGRGRSPWRWSGTLIWALAASMLTASAVVFGAPSTSHIYGIDDANQLWVMGLSGTSVVTAEVLGTSTTQLTGSNANGLAYDRSREQLFVADTFTDELFWWQQGATAYTSLGSLVPYTSAGKPVSAAYFDNAYWFLGGGTPGNHLNKLSMTYTNGIPTIASGTSFEIVGMPTSASGGGDLVITPDGLLYAYSALGAGKFFSVNLNTIASGTVGGYNVILDNTNNPNSYAMGLQIALGVDDTTLYGTFNGTWYIVDKATGETTAVGGLSTPSFRDLGGSSIKAVPEPGTVALAATGLGIVAWQLSRRRKSRGPGDGEFADGSPGGLLT